MKAHLLFRMLRKIFVCLTLLTLLPNVSEAQYNNPRGRIPKQLLGLSVGARAGATVYFGDLVDAGRARWTVGAFVEKSVISWLDVRGQIDAGQVHGAQEEGIEFKSFFADVNVIARVRFLDLIQGYDDARLFCPYFGLGAGGMLFNCKKNPDESKIDVEAYMSKATAGGWEDLAEKWLYYDGGMKGAADAVGLVGVRYSLSSKLWLSFEVQGYMVFSDELDAHSGYPDNNGTWVESDGKYDCLWTTSFGVQYRFYDVSKYTSSSKYSRKNYLKTRRIYERNAKRMRRR